MSTIVRFFVGLWLIWLPIATLIYITSNGAIAQFKSLTLSQVADEMTRLDPDDEAAMPDGYEDRVIQINNSILTNDGMKVHESLYHAIKSNPDVTDVEIEKNIASSDKHGDIYMVTMSFTYQDQRYSLNVLVVGKSFMHPWQSRVLSFDSLGTTEKSGTEASVPDNQVLLFLGNFTMDHQLPLSTIFGQNNIPLPQLEIPNN